MDQDILKIPAFKRKRNIDSRAKKKLLLTAFERKEAGIPVIKRSRPKVRRAYSRPKSSSTFTPPMIFDDPISNRDLESIKSMQKSTQFSEPISGLREMEICGVCDGYLGNIEVALIELTDTLRKGDRVLFETENGLFEQIVSSMQIDRKDVKIARRGSGIGMKVLREPKKNGKVYRVS